MIILDVTCHGREHYTRAAQRRGCVCPLDDAPSPVPPRAPCRNPERKSHNQRGPNLATVTLADIDEVAVERAVAGDRTLVLATAERLEAVKRIDRPGVSSRLIAERLGVSRRTVFRARRQLRSGVTGEGS